VGSPHLFQRPFLCFFFLFFWGETPPNKNIFKPHLFFTERGLSLQLFKFTPFCFPILVGGDNPPPNAFSLWPQQGFCAPQGPKHPRGGPPFFSPPPYSYFPLPPLTPPPRPPPPPTFCFPKGGGTIRVVYALPTLPPPFPPGPTGPFPPTFPNTGRDGLGQTFLLPQQQGAWPFFFHPILILCRLFPLGSKV